MRISIFGLGYVGAVSSACFAKSGHYVIGVDRDPYKVELINEGKSPIIEKDIKELIKLNVKAGRFKATTEPATAVHETEISLICVGTPSLPNGNIDLSSIKKVSSDIGKAISKKQGYHLVVNRSTVLPGTMQNVIVPLLEKYSGKKVGKDFGVACNPEFLRESTAVYDFFNPPKTVIGRLNPKDGEKVSRLYKGIAGSLIQTSIEIAEFVKYTDNSFHALKVTFANEVGHICKKLGIDSHEVMNIFCQDTKLNLSPYYLKPGFAFGGSCLPKDLRAITHLCRHKDLNLPVLNAIEQSNRLHIDYAFSLIHSKAKKKVGFFGFAFKAGTDDLRESPVVTLIELLLGKGYEIKIYDKNVTLSRLRGTNKLYIEEKIPHIAALMSNELDEVISFGEVIVIGNKGEEFVNILSQMKPEQHILDLVRISEEFENEASYEGICW